MGKQSGVRWPYKSFQLARYKWEFLRRSKEYRDDYKLVIRLRNALRSRQPRKRLERLLSLLSEGERRARDAWGLSGWLDPSNSFPEDILEAALLHDLFPFPEPAIKVWTRPPEGSQEKIKAAVTSPSPEKFEAVHAVFREVKWLNVGINLEASWSSIVADLEMVIREWKRQRGGTRRESRVRLSVYDDYLKIYDLREQGLSFVKIGRRLYPSYSRRDAEEKVRKAYKACLQLISGGYQKIRL